MTIPVTGAAGFIGYHVAGRLLARLAARPGFRHPISLRRHQEGVRRFVQWYRDYYRI